MLNLTNKEENTKKNHIEIFLHTHQTDKKISLTIPNEMLWNNENSYSLQI